VRRWLPVPHGSIRGSVLSCLVNRDTYRYTQTYPYSKAGIHITIFLTRQQDRHLSLQPP
jgi:hypothetical protein